MGIKGVGSCVLGLGNEKPQSRCRSALTGVLNYALPFPVFLAGAFATLRGAAALAFFTVFIL